MYLKRNVDSELIIWKESIHRKPLLLRGARQVGKSTVVRNLSKKFEFFIEINFDENPIYEAIFANSLNPKEICEQITLVTNVSIIPNKTLLFFDEIQACIPAISSLRYFYEKMPELHLIAAGSLLEFALEEIPSFGVGRIRFLFMYPFSFEEFLLANNEQPLVSFLNKATPQQAIPDIIHHKIKTFFKKFLVIGGMPEAVNAYVTHGDMQEVQRVLDDLIISVQSDFAKYKNKISTLRVKEVFDTVVQQVGNKFTYSYSNATLNNVQIKEILTLLKMAGLVHFVTHSAANRIPIGAEINTKKRKILIFDTGIFQRILGLNIAELLIKDDFEVINKGNIAELYVGLELMKNSSCYQKDDLYYWHRESLNSQAEVDYLIQKEENIIPIEVKAGTRGAMQSMYLFIEEKKAPYGIRLSLENFSTLENIKIYPLYAVKNVVVS